MLSTGNRKSIICKKMKSIYQNRIVVGFTCLMGIAVTVTSSILNITIENDDTGGASLVAAIVQNQTAMPMPSQTADDASLASKNLSANFAPTMQSAVLEVATVDETNCTMTRKRHAGGGCYRGCSKNQAKDAIFDSPLCKTPFFFPLCCLQAAIRRRYTNEDPSSAYPRPSFLPCLNGVCCNSTKVVIQEKGGKQLSNRVIKDIQFVDAMPESRAVYQPQPADSVSSQKRDVYGYDTNDCVHDHHEVRQPEHTAAEQNERPCPDGSPGRTLYFKLIDKDEAFKQGGGKRAALHGRHGDNLRHWKRESDHPDNSEEVSWTDGGGGVHRRRHRRRRLNVKNFRIAGIKKKEEEEREDDDDGFNPEEIPVLFSDDLDESESDYDGDRVHRADDKAQDEYDDEDPDEGGVEGDPDYGGHGDLAGDKSDVHDDDDDDWDAVEEDDDYEGLESAASPSTKQTTTTKRPAKKSTRIKTPIRRSGRTKMSLSKFSTAEPHITVILTTVTPTTESSATSMATPIMKTPDKLTKLWDSKADNVHETVDSEENEHHFGSFSPKFKKTSEKRKRYNEDDEDEPVQ